jgi:protein-L-isoaspartate(D-aspartate) O-methyltransferase
VLRRRAPNRRHGTGHDAGIARDEMLEHLRDGGVHSDRVLRAMESVPREAFVGEDNAGNAYANRALVIGFDQTISQPLMVALLVQALDIRDGDRALDVGTGSGYQAAVLAACGAQVVSIERIPELAHAAARRLSRLGLPVAVHVGDGSIGLARHAPYDAIAVGAAAPRIPRELVAQLSDGGRLVVPVRGDHGAPDELTRVTRAAGREQVETLGTCRFVPLIGAAGYRDTADHSARRG